MAILELDTLFKSYLNDYEKELGSRVDQDDLPDVYRRWLDTPCAELQGVKPGQLFARTDPNAMIEAFLSYHRAGLAIPVQLLDAIGDSRACEVLLGDIVKGEIDASNDARMNALELLHESGSGLVPSLCMDVLNNEDDEEFLDIAMDFLAARGSSVLEELLGAFSLASDAGKDRICVLLAEMPEDERIFDILMKRFRDEKNDVGLYAALLRRYGNSEAKTELEAALKKGRIHRYVDFVSIKDAIESFGGHVSETPEFPGDPDYERIKQEL